MPEISTEAQSAIKRAIELLDATEDLIDRNSDAAEMPVKYDGTTCDGLCLAEDCAAASEALRRVLVEGN